MIGFSFCLFFLSFHLLLPLDLLLFLAERRDKMSTAFWARWHGLSMRMELQSSHDLTLTICTSDGYMSRDGSI